MKKIIGAMLLLFFRGFAQGADTIQSQLTLLNSLSKAEKGTIKDFPGSAYRALVNDNCASEIKKQPISNIISGDIATLTKEFFTITRTASTGDCVRLSSLVQFFQSQQQTIPSLSSLFSTTLGSHDPRYVPTLLAKYTIQRRLHLMMQQGILTSKDIDLLKNKIKFSYTRQCDTKYGEYTTTQSNNIVSLYSLTVRINICEEAAYTQSLTDIVDQLLIHEIGHHLYYFHDTNPQSFENICRKDGTSNCFEKDFVSGYAQGSAKEDYAETFYNFYTTISQQTLSTSGDKLGDKVNYFRKNYTIK